MKPIEKVAIAISGAPFPSPKSLAKARAALLALADVELPEQALDAGTMALACSKEHAGADAFRAILRSIASEGGDDGKGQ